MADSNNYSPTPTPTPTPTPVPDSVTSNGTESEPEAKIPKLEGIVFLIFIK